MRMAEINVLFGRDSALKLIRILRINVAVNKGNLSRNKSV